jgi:hypothetical protein
MSRKHQRTSGVTIDRTHRPLALRSARFGPQSARLCLHSRATPAKEAPETQSANTVHELVDHAPLLGLGDQFLDTCDIAQRIRPKLKTYRSMTVRKIDHELEEVAVADKDEIDAPAVEVSALARER